METLDPQASHSISASSIPFLFFCAELPSEPEPEKWNHSFFLFLPCPFFKPSSLFVPSFPYPPLFFSFFSAPFLAPVLLSVVENE